MSKKRQTEDALCHLLATGDEADRCYAARTLGVLRAHSAVTSLLERLRDEDIDVCVDAAEALGRIADPGAKSALLESLDKESNGEICTAVVTALGRIGGDDILTPLLKVVQERPEGLEWEGDWDTWWDVQLEAVRALGKLGDERAVDALLSILDDEDQQGIEGEILSALARIEGRGVNSLINRLREGPAISRRRAARALALASSDNATKALGRALRDPEPEVRAAAATALADRGARRYLSAVLLLLRDQDQAVRSAAIQACARMSDQISDTAEMQADLLPLLEDPSSQVRARVFETLATALAPRQLAPEALAMVLASLNDKDANLVSAACDLLGSQRAGDAVPELIGVLRGPERHPMERRQAALALGKIHPAGRSAIDTLRGAISDKEQSVRMASLCALAELDLAGPWQGDGDVALPLDIVIGAVKGEIDPDGRATPKHPAPDGGPGAMTSPEEQAIRFNTLEKQPPPVNADTAKASETEEKNAPPALSLPDFPAQIVEEGEVKTAQSTLDAIAMDNVEVALTMNLPAQEDTPTDEITEHFLRIVDENEQAANRMFPPRKISVTLDIRRLGARVLANSCNEQAIAALITALNDEDAELRREAAESLAEIARQDPGIPALTNALGSLITQLTLDEPDQKIASARALGYLGNRAAVPPLFDKLEDESSHVRIEAIRALARLGAAGADADHMVVREIAPLTLAHGISDRLDDDESGVRIEAANALASLLLTNDLESFTDQALDKIIATAFAGAGEQSRQMGQVLRRIDTGAGTAKLLARLASASNSLERRFVIEMLEELFNPEAGQSEQVA